jgi:uncharacterized protein (TIGR00290 family)
MEKPKEKAILSWSGGKDSALALYEVQVSRDCEIVTLLTTITEGYQRSSMHGVRRPLIEQQACAVGVPLEKVPLSLVSSNEEYEARMREILKRYKDQGVSAVVFGDIFLEDVRTYREDRLASIGMKGIFPLWGKETVELARTFLGLGFKAVITCVDSEQMDPSYAGRAFDEQMLTSLPAQVDPCGENGEFHSFVHDGPIFRQPVAFSKGEVVLREERFAYCDLVPTGG